MYLHPKNILINSWSSHLSSSRASLFSPTMSMSLTYQRGSSSTKHGLELEWWYPRFVIYSQISPTTFLVSTLDHTVFSKACTRFLSSWTCTIFQLLRSWEKVLVTTDEKMSSLSILYILLENICLKTYLRVSYFVSKYRNTHKDTKSPVLFLCIDSILNSMVRSHASTITCVKGSLSFFRLMKPSPDV
jgi:hypothetical protein